MEKKKVTIYLSKTALDMVDGIVEHAEQNKEPVPSKTAVINLALELGLEMLAKQNNNKRRD